MKPLYASFHTALEVRCIMNRQVSVCANMAIVNNDIFDMVCRQKSDMADNNVNNNIQFEYLYVSVVEALNTLVLIITN